MYIGVFDLFRVGIGPSSSHTVGPMRAAKRFAEIAAANANPNLRIQVELFGSLGLTGKGHGTGPALLLGLNGWAPDIVDPDLAAKVWAQSEASGNITLLDPKAAADSPGLVVRMKPTEDILFHRRALPLHPNGMKFSALGADGETSIEKTYYSIGGGFLADENGLGEAGSAERQVPYFFGSGKELLELCETHGLSISTLMRDNEYSLHSPDEVKARIAAIWKVMQGCVTRGCEREGILPGGLQVKRRAASMYRKLKSSVDAHDTLFPMDWVNLWALAVNEENAAGGRVVTAPTNGAAGIIPAVLHFYKRFIKNADDEGVERFLFTAAAIGSLYKRNASISGAEVGCQGEVGVACSMAAAGLCEVMGGTPEQVENAAEIGMEHNLGLTCDPIGGLVQVPCIERNAMAAVKAINAARLSISGDGSHKVSLDKVIAVMRQTGADMSTKYKETARGGLALNIVEC